MAIAIGELHAPGILAEAPNLIARTLSSASRSSGTPECPIEEASDAAGQQCRRAAFATRTGHNRLELPQGIPLLALDQRL